MRSGKRLEPRLCQPGEPEVEVVGKVCAREEGRERLTEDELSSDPDVKAGKV